jgi:hypothetical protein
MEEHIKSKTNVECPICGGHGWVCERHPDRPYESGSARDCDCGAPGMPCQCEGLK